MKSLNATIEPLSLLDLDALLLQATDCFISLQEGEYRAERLKKMHDNAVFCAVRNEYGNVVGIIAFYANRQPVAYITHVFVNSAFRRRGLLRMMMEKTEAYASEHGFTQLRLEVSRDNTRAQQAYRRLGFKPNGLSDGGIYMSKECQCSLKDMGGGVNVEPIRSEALLLAA